MLPARARTLKVCSVDTMLPVAVASIHSTLVQLEVMESK